VRHSHIALTVCFVLTTAACGGSSSPAAPSTNTTPSVSSTAPSITTISPASPTAGLARQALTITGANFASGSSLVFTTPAGAAKTLVNGPPNPNEQSMQVVSSTSMIANVVIDALGTYTFQVVNANGERSNSATAPSQGILSGVLLEGVRLTDASAGFPGQPFADVAAFPTRSGGWRLLFDAGGAIRSASSPDGLSLTMESGTRIPTRLNDGTGVRPALVKVLRLDSGQLRVFFSSGNMYSAISDDDGLTFTVEDGVRVNAGAVGASIITSGSVVRSGGRWRMYFGDAERVYSASSSDLLNWTVDPGVRVGAGSTLGSSPAVHPCAILNADGSVSLVVFHGPSPSNPAPGLEGLYITTSTDGLAFTHEVWTGIDAFDPDIVPISGGGLRLYYNRGDNTGGTIYSARLPALSASLTQQSLTVRTSRSAAR
jgi:hypothetical protein